jgi:hypothetical protein
MVVTMLEWNDIDISQRRKSLFLAAKYQIRNELLALNIHILLPKYNGATIFYH